MNPAYERFRTIDLASGQIDLGLIVVDEFPAIERFAQIGLDAQEARRAFIGSPVIGSEGLVQTSSALQGLLRGDQKGFRRRTVFRKKGRPGAGRASYYLLASHGRY